MRAAVVTSFDTPPAYQDFPTPTPQTPDEVLVDVVAAGLHPRVRSQADGSHYTSSGELPLVPGIDGVGRAPDGTLRYFVLPDTRDGCDGRADGRRPAPQHRPARRQRPGGHRRGHEPGHVLVDRPAPARHLPARPAVLVLGATGNAGRMAVQVARHLGAGHVIGAGRRPERLAALTDLGADATVSLDGDPAEVAERLGKAARDVDVVLDYLWGEPTAEAMLAVVMNRTDRAQPLTWIEIGSVAGPTAAVPSAALRAARLQIVGSGQGSVPTRDIVAELPALAAEITNGTFRIDTRTVPLSDIETAWNDIGRSQRIVITP